MSDIGASAFGRWHFWQLRCRIGAMSLVNVGCSTAVCAATGADARASAASPTRLASRLNLRVLSIMMRILTPARPAHSVPVPVRLFYPTSRSSVATPGPSPPATARDAPAGASLLPVTTVMPPSRQTQSARKPAARIAASSSFNGK